MSLRIKSAPRKNIDYGHRWRNSGFLIEIKVSSSGASCGGFLWPRHQIAAALICQLPVEPTQL